MTEIVRYSIVCDELIFQRVAVGRKQIMDRYIAVDLGASSGRIILGGLEDGRIFLEEIHRFENGPVKESGSLRWDFAKLFGDIKAGLGKAIRKTDGKVVSIGVDSWGVDFGLINSNGNLIENPYHYRDSRTDGIMDKAFALMPKKEIYDSTGTQFMQLNTIFQLLSLRLNQPGLLQKADKLIFMADLVSYHLCDEIFAEYTLASTSQLMDMRTGCWSKDVFDKMSLPMDVMPKVIVPGAMVGKLKDVIAKELGCEPIPVIAVGSHDTASAVAAVPADDKDNWAYLSSGTWSLMGVETSETIINDRTLGYEFTNEGGVENTIRLLKNIMGLWLVQECRRIWNIQGDNLSFSDMTELADKAEPFSGFINPNDDRFLVPCNMPAKINEYLCESGQEPIGDRGQITRMILESLAFNYRRVIEMLQDITGRQIEILHIVGGGIKNHLLCQFAADATGKKVIAGPVEATAMGNIMMQAIAAGHIKTVAYGREIIRNSIEVKEYVPSDSDVWVKEYQRARKFF